MGRELAIEKVARFCVTRESRRQYVAPTRNTSSSIPLPVRLPAMAILLAKLGLSILAAWLGNILRERR